MCGSRRNHCCGSRRQPRQPLIAQAAVAAYSAYNKRKEQRAIAANNTYAYPDTLAAADAQYRTVASTDEKAEKAPIPVSSASRAMPDDAPPAYETIAPTARPKLQRSNSSASSVSSVSSVSSTETQNIAGIPAHLLNKRAFRLGRKELRRALKHARSMEEAQNAVLQGMALLFGIPAEKMHEFGKREVDANTAVVVAEWARRSAKSRVSVGKVLEAGRMGEVAGVVAGGSRKVRVGR